MLHIVRRLVDRNGIKFEVRLYVDNFFVDFQRKKMDMIEKIPTKEKKNSRGKRSEAPIYS
jgi:hypothetical protein